MAESSDTMNQQAHSREITVIVELAGGHRHEVKLDEDSKELFELFQAMARRSVAGSFAEDPFFQLPMDGGQSACSFLLSQVVSLVSSPPVVVQPEFVEPQPEPQPQPRSELVPEVQAEHAREELSQAARPELHPSHYVVVDDFLSPDEHRDMLAYALNNNAKFESGTVTTDQAYYRRNLVYMDFGNSAQATLVTNRLLILYPLLMQKLGKKLVPLEAVESQLTASNNGHYFKSHQDAGEGDDTTPRELSCIYYFNREPKNFAGGELRLYDTISEGNHNYPAASFHEIEPRSNRLVVFPSEKFHELCKIRCPSGKFKDSRFAITTWIRRAQQQDPDAVFGWGHFHCAVIPPGFD